MSEESPNRTTKLGAAAGLLLVTLAVAQVIPIGMALLVDFGGIQDQVVRALDRNPQPMGETGAIAVVAGANLAAAIAFIGALALAVLAWRVGRGSAGARTAARVVCAVLLLWSVVVTLFNPVGGPMTLLAPAADTENMLSGRQFQEQINLALPGWMPPALIGFTALTAVLVVAIFIALARRRPNPLP